MRGVLPFALCALVLRASAWSVAPPTLPGVRHAPRAPAVRVVLLLPPPPPQSGAPLADGGAPEERWLRRRVARAVRGARSTLNAALNVLLALLVCVAPLCAPPAIAAPVAVEVAASLQAAAVVEEEEAAPPAAIEAGLPAIARVPEQQPNVRPSAGRTKTSFVTSAVQAVGPAVVRIDTERLVDRAPLEGYLFPGLEPEGQRKEAGQGSGVLLSEDGLIMTNAHVVKNAARVTVTLTDGRTFEGVVKGSDDFMDLAAVRIKPSGKRLPTAPLGRSDELQVGDWVIAIGNAVGLDSTVTLGIVSSLSRSSAEVGIPNKKVNFIQTDAAINPGNSGGPLLDSSGRLIGVNTAIYAPGAAAGAAGNVGIGFAIPVDTVRRVVNELIRYGAVVRPTLGINVADDQTTRGLFAQLRLPLEGVLVMSVAPRSPAAVAGLQPTARDSRGQLMLGDLVTEVGGAPVRQVEDLLSAIEERRVGEEVPLKVLRGCDPQREQTLRAKLVSREQLSKL